MSPLPLSPPVGLPPVGLPPVGLPPGGLPLVGLPPVRSPPGGPRTAPPLLLPGAVTLPPPIACGDSSHAGRVSRARPLPVTDAPNTAGRDLPSTPYPPEQRAECAW